ASAHSRPSRNSRRDIHQRRFTIGRGTTEVAAARRRRELIGSVAQPMSAATVAKMAGVGNPTDRARPVRALAITTAAENAAGATVTSGRPVAASYLVAAVLITTSRAPDVAPRTKRALASAAPDSADPATSPEPAKAKTTPETARRPRRPTTWPVSLIEAK